MQDRTDTAIIRAAPYQHRLPTCLSPLWEHFTSEHCIISCIDHTYWHSSTPENHRKLHSQNFKCSHYGLERAGGWCWYGAALTMAVSVRARIYRQFFLCSMRYSLDTQLSKPWILVLLSHYIQYCRQLLGQSLCTCLYHSSTTYFTQSLHYAPTY